MPAEFEDRVAVVVGATSGIGEATARTFGRLGAATIVAGRSEAAGETVAREIRHAGGEALFIACDVTRPADIDNLFETTLAKYGGLDFAVNNFGYVHQAVEFVDIPDDDWTTAMDTNLRATFLCMRHEIRQMKKQGRGGGIVNTSSLAGVKGAAWFAAYAASKYGVNGLTTSAAVEYAPLGIRVNAVCPSVIETPMTHQAFDPASQAALLERLPMARMGNSQEMADAIVYLCSEKASFITGVILPVDGGWMAR